MKLAVVGGGWAGLAAAVRATQAGHGVTLYEMAGQLGGRPRRDPLQHQRGIGCLTVFLTACDTTTTASSATPM